MLESVFATDTLVQHVFFNRIIILRILGVWLYKPEMLRMVTHCTLITLSR